MHSSFQPHPFTVDHLLLDKATRLHKSMQPSTRFIHAGNHIHRLELLNYRITSSNSSPIALKPPPLYYQL
jgi:hypothetical protein